MRSEKWGAGEVEAYLWKQGDYAIEQRLDPREDVYAIWDESVLEKASSLALDGLCAVRSSVARQLKRIKPGFYTPNWSNVPPVATSKRA